MSSRCGSTLTPTRKNAQKNYNHYWNSLKIVGFVFAYTNSCVNPVALYFISTNFRKYFDRLLFSCCRSAENRSVDDETRPRPQDRRRQYGRRNPFNEFQPRGSHQQSSFEVTSSDKRTTSINMTRMSHRLLSVPCTMIKSLEQSIAILCRLLHPLML
jgi:hypothetical protein